jgi:uncharacterized membrane protein YebE (DUF533 family)
MSTRSDRTSAEPQEPASGERQLRSLPNVEAALDAGILSVLGTKVLHAWLRNQHQLLFPLTVDLDGLDERARDRLVQAAVIAALADGDCDAVRQSRIEEGLRLLLGRPCRPEAVARARAWSWPLHEALAAEDMRTAGLVYAATLIGSDRRSPAGRLYTRYVAARLSLPDELVRSLERRFPAV